MSATRSPAALPVPGLGRWAAQPPFQVLRGAGRQTGGQSGTVFGETLGAMKKAD